MCVRPPPPLLSGPWCDAMATVCKYVDRWPGRMEEETEAAQAVKTSFPQVTETDMSKDNTNQTIPFFK